MYSLLAAQQGNPRKLVFKNIDETTVYHSLIYFRQNLGMN